MSDLAQAAPAADPGFGLTQGQRYAVWIIQELTQLDGVPPSVAEIARELGNSSKGRTHAILSSLKRRGWIDWIPGHRRSLVLRRPLPWPAGFAEECPSLEVVRLP